MFILKWWLWLYNVLDLRLDVCITNLTFITYWHLLFGAKRNRTLTLEANKNVNDLYLPVDSTLRWNKIEELCCSYYGNHWYLFLLYMFIIVFIYLCKKPLLSILIYQRVKKMCGSTRAFADDMAIFYQLQNVNQTNEKINGLLLLRSWCIIN